MAKPPPKVPENADDKEQSERFIKTALDYDADVTGKALDDAFKAIARPPPDAARPAPPRPAKPHRK